jgi:hypothetical protein
MVGVLAFCMLSEAMVTYVSLSAPSGLSLNLQSDTDTVSKMFVDRSLPFTYNVASNLSSLWVLYFAFTSCMP